MTRAIARAINAICQPCIVLVLLDLVTACLANDGIPP
jgi:hypothetical protein